MHFDAEFYVAVGFTIFVLVMIWVGAHSKFAAFIDARINRIKGELAEAERCATKRRRLLASFEQKRAEAEAEAKAIVAQAKEEAELIAAEGRRGSANSWTAASSRSNRRSLRRRRRPRRSARRRRRRRREDRRARVLRRRGRGKDFVGDGIKELKALAH